MLHFLHIYLTYLTSICKVDFRCCIWRGSTVLPSEVCNPFPRWGQRRRHFAIKEKKKKEKKDEWRWKYKSKYEYKSLTGRLSGVKSKLFVGQEVKTVEELWSWTRGSVVGGVKESLVPRPRWTPMDTWTPMDVHVLFVSCLLIWFPEPWCFRITAPWGSWDFCSQPQLQRPWKHVPCFCEDTGHVQSEGELKVSSTVAFTKKVPPSPTPRVSVHLLTQFNKCNNLRLEIVLQILLDWYPYYMLEGVISYI